MILLRTGGMIRIGIKRNKEAFCTPPYTGQDHKTVPSKRIANCILLFDGKYIGKTGNIKDLFYFLGSIGDHHAALLVHDLLCGQEDSEAGT